ncbi:MAG: citramalate synthase [Rhodobacteraceae bacterium]|nr:citramalate synthase [Paracoccaceae bacterium]
MPPTSDKERLWLFDTTLRDGQQTQGVDFSAVAKRKIAEALDKLGIDYIEGGWPGANPTDSDFFRDAPRFDHARLTAFGMTKRVGISASNDPVLAEVLNAGTPAVCLVGKTHDFHVTTALGVNLAENRDAIAESVAHLVEEGREALFDAEHFFDGWKADRDYALSCLEAALEAGAAWVVLCDTNGGALPEEIGEIVNDVAQRVPRHKLGIHTHNDSETAVAGALAAVRAGARQIQGTLNGLGERCGNANLISLIPTLMLKEPYASQLETGVGAGGLASLTAVSHMLDEVLNRAPNRHAPYVGAAAFTHKAGLHASAVVKDPTTYEHVPPEVVGNARVVPMSNQAGRSNLLRRLEAAGIPAQKDDPRLTRLLSRVKELEEKGFAYDSAEASFELLAHSELGMLPTYFDVERFRVTVERRYNAVQELVTVSEAVVAVNVGGIRRLSVSESLDPETKSDQGPVNALSRALRMDLGIYQGFVDDLELVDFRVRILSTGTEAVTRVLVDSQDAQGRRWTTVGVSANIVDASFQAVVESIVYKLLRDGAPANGG